MITVQWDLLTPRDDRWKAIHCLYSYLHPNRKEILYIGKAWDCTVKERWTRAGKDHFWNDLEDKRRITRHIPLIGEVFLTEGTRLTDQLLSDVESLLICAEKP